jgi:ribosomal RNA-processing protein 9
VLFSASYDRTVKLYDLSPSVMGYVETLFGHQDAVTSLDALARETCVSTGARDKTVRFWKVVDETQLVFRGGGRSKIRDVLEGGGLADEEEDKERGGKKFVEGSIDSVVMIDETTFASGGDSG